MPARFLDRPQLTIRTGARRLTSAAIFANGNLDDYHSEDLREAGAPTDGFGAVSFLESDLLVPVVLPPGTPDSDSEARGVAEAYSPSSSRVTLLFPASLLVSPCEATFSRRSRRVLRFQTSPLRIALRAAPPRNVPTRSDLQPLACRLLITIRGPNVAKRTVDKAQAKLKDGILTLTLPKTKESKRKAVQIDVE